MEQSIVSAPATTSWNLDLSHSELQFKVRHMMISTVTGEFQNFSINATTEGDDFATASVSLTADVATINTRNEQRDAHLRSDDFFAADQFPQLSFASTSMQKLDDENYKLHGNLTIRDITKPVTLDVEFGGLAVDHYGNLRAGFTLQGKINRKEFGLMWSAITEAGGVVVADDVKLVASVSLVQG